MVCYRILVRSYNERCDCSKRVQRQNRNRIKQVKIWLLRKRYIQNIAKILRDSKYCKNLFREANRDILDFVQQVHGDVLPRDKTLSQLVCRSCERKVKNPATVEKTIAETQRLLVEKKSRAKRCLKLSPSATAPKPKNCAKVSARTRANLRSLCRRLFFTIAG